MSIGTLITRGYGSFGSVPYVILHGLGAFGGAQIGAGGIDWENWAKPPEGFRRILDTAGIDLAANREKLLNQARREIGLLRDDDPEPPAPEIEIDVEPARVEPPKPPAFDREAFIIDMVAQLRREAAEAEVVAKIARDERIARETWLMRDQENVLLLVAAAI